MVIDANREIPEDFDIEEFIIKIKNSNKEQINIAFKNKNKIWFPLTYDSDSSLIKFTPTQTTIIQLSTHDNFIIFKDDERDIPILGVYFYEPITSSSNYLNQKLRKTCCHVNNQGSVFGKCF